MAIEVTRERALQSLPPRRPDTHKGDYGRALLICGSAQYTGAAFFAAQAAVNSGSGIVFLAVPDVIRPILAQKLNEPILLSRGDAPPSHDVCLFGCGVGRNAETEALAEKLLAADGAPLILDADAISAIADRALDLASSPRTVILTPHEGEFRRLVPEYAPSRREEFALNFATENNCILILKCHRTLTALPSGALYINTTGNPGMAKGGSGDVLAGVLASLVAQGIPTDIAAYTGVWLHGAAGDLARDKYGEYGMTPTDTLRELKSVLKGVRSLP